MTDRKRPALPRAYQFGDAGSDVAMRAIDESDGSRVLFRADFRGSAVAWAKNWNVIEAEVFTSDAERYPVIEGAKTDV